MINAPESYQSLRYEQAVTAFERILLLLLNQFSHRMISAYKKFPVWPKKKRSEPLGYHQYTPAQFCDFTTGKGADWLYIQELLGHVSSKTTEIYTHITQKGLNRIKSPLEVWIIEHKVYEK